MRASDPCRTCRDARELLERERARASLAEAREASKDRLVEIASAESRAMANSLLGWTQALKRDFANRATRAYALDLMETRVTAHLALLDKLLDASETSFGGELSLMRLELRDLVDSAIRSERAYADERSVSLVETHPSAAAVVLGDRQRLGRSLRDLVGACTRAATNGGSVEISLTTEATTAVVRFTIEANRAVVDDASVGVRAARHGAAIHGGAVEALADGFLMRLPLADAPARAPALPGKTLLVVRHEPDVTEILAALGVAHGLRVLTVHDEELAARAFELHDPDVVALGSPESVERMQTLIPRGRDRVRMISSAADAKDLVREASSGEQLD